MPPAPSPNRELYDLGRPFADRVAALIPAGAGPSALLEAIRVVAAGRPVVEVRTAVLFVRANDCKQCPAHLLHFRRRPSVEPFVAALGANGSGGYSVHHQRL